MTLLKCRVANHRNACLQTAEKINNMLRQYEQLQALHMWLVKRVERGLSIPETMEETTELVRSDPTGFPAHKFRYAALLVFAVFSLQRSYKSTLLFPTSQTEAAPIQLRNAKLCLHREPTAVSESTPRR